MVFQQVKGSPIIAKEDYATRYDKAVTPEEEPAGITMEFHGTGVRISEHPLKDRISMYGCGSCQSEDVLVIYAQWSVHPMSGDVYWDYEVVCQSCGKFTSRSFAGND